MSSLRWLCVIFVAACQNAAVEARVQQRAGGSLAPATVPETASVIAPVATSAGRSSPFAECVSTGTIHANLRPTNILFLIDRSSSMACNLPPTTSSVDCERSPVRTDPSQPSKWEIVRSALRDAIDQLPEATRAGISYFSNNDMCGVQSTPSVSLRELDPAQRTAVAQSLDAVEPRGGTPLVGGLILAYKHLNPDQTPDAPWGNRFVVLLTDGQEGCATEQTTRLLETELPKSRSAGIVTFVIGVPGSEVNRGYLSRLAFAGGAPSRPDCDHRADDPALGDCQLDMTRDSDLSQGLARALAAIGGQALRCEFDLPQPLDGEILDYDAVNVVYTDRPGGEESIVRQDATSPCDTAHGWQYSADRRKILLCGSACGAVRHAASIRIALGCQTLLQ